MRDGAGVQGLQPGRPVSLTSDDPHHDQAACRAVRLHMASTDGMRSCVVVPGQMQTRHIWRAAGAPAQCWQVRPGGGKKHDLTRRLAKIDVASLPRADRSLRRRMTNQGGIFHGPGDGCFVNHRAGQSPPAGRAWLILAPWSVEIMFDTRPHRLHHKAHRLRPSTSTKPFRRRISQVQQITAFSFSRKSLSDR